MTNYSRTTLRELKKRYLNVLKKCLLANLMAFSFCLPAGAEELSLLDKLLQDGAIVTTQEETVNLSNDLKIMDTSNLTLSKLIFEHKTNITGTGSLFFFDMESNKYETGDASASPVPIIVNKIKNEITFDVITEFSNNKSTGLTVNGATGSSHVIVNSGGILNFKKYSSFINNSTIVQTQTGSADATATVLSNSWAWINGVMNDAIVNFFDGALFKNNTATAISTGETLKRTAAEGSIIYQFWGHANFFGTIDFIGNSVIASSQYAPVEAKGGAILNDGREMIFNDNVNFIGNNAIGTSNYGTARASGGAIKSTSKLDFKGYTTFINNAVKATSVNATATITGGAIYAAGTNAKISFYDNFLFSENKSIINGITKKNSIYTNKGIVNILGGDKTIGTIEGGIAGSSEGSFNKSGAGLLVLGDQSENHEYEGAFTQTAGVTIANSERFFSHEKAVNTINGGELKTHGAEIGYKATLGETGTLTHLGTSADTPTEIKGVTFNGTGLNLTLGTYTKAEQEKEIALVGDRLVEYMDDKGTEDTSDDELVSYQATDKLFTVKVLENDQKAKFILNENLTGMDGNTLTIDNAELDVKEGLKVASKVVAKDMTVSKGRTPVSFTNLEVAKSGILDIGTREMNVDSITLQEGSTLKIALNSLQEHGKINGLVTGSETSKIALNLATDVEMGTYQLFDQDNDIALEENLFFNIKDLENGAYQIKKKISEEMASTFGGANQAATALALLESESTHKAFNQMQSEMLEALQSEDKAQVQKAKKALSAVGTSEQPSSQSIAASHFNELTRVISQMVMEKEAEIVGHSGGDTNPRAKVYIKGLYDRTKSSMGEGFRARSKGAVLGVQSEVTEDLTLGVGYATSQTTAKEDLRRTEVDTNTGFISAHYQPNAWWVSGLATFSRGEYEEEKQILSSMGKASYNVDSWGAQVMTGYDIKLENAIITPEVGMRYLSVKQEGYTDTLGTTVSGTQSDYLTALVGVKGTWGMGAVRPTAGVTVGYDVISDDVSALNTLANGASYTVNGEALDRLSTGVSLGVEADLGERTTLKLEYSGTFRKEYEDHSGMLKLEMKF